MTDRARVDSPEPLPSLGVQTPPPPPPPPPPPTTLGRDSTTTTTTSSTGIETGGTGYIASMWGLIRRFSSEETTQFTAQVNSALFGDNNEDSSSSSDGVNGVFNPVKHRIASPFRPPPLEPLVLKGYRDDTPSSARLLSGAVAEEIRAMVPERLRIIDDWRLVYSLEQDGSSLATLYQKCQVFQGMRAGFVLVVRDQEGATFGAYLSEYPHPYPSYFGNGECFLWRASTLASLPPPPSADTTSLTRSTTLQPPTPTTPRSGAPSPTPSDMIRFKAFPYSGLNDFYINCEQRFLSVGSGGGHYGLWLDDSLDAGRSSRCETFGNEPLSDEGEKFGVLGVELWVMG